MPTSQTHSRLRPPSADSLPRSRGIPVGAVGFGEWHAWVNGHVLDLPEYWRCAKREQISPVVNVKPWGKRLTLVLPWPQIGQRVDEVEVGRLRADSDQKVGLGSVIARHQVD